MDREESMAETPPTTIFSSAVEQLEPEQAFIYLEMAAEVREKGIDVISFGIGQTDFLPPAPVLEAIKKAVDEGRVGYTPATGIPELREAISEFVNEKYGTDVEPEEVAVTAGAKSALFMCITLLTKPGDEVVVPDPGFPAYECIVRYAGGRPVFATLREEEGFKMTPELVAECLGERARGIILNYPHNPTGSTLGRRDLDEILELARERNLWIVTDEIYDHFVYEDRHYSLLENENWRDHVVYINGFSKTWAMTGLRLGFVVARKEIVEKLKVYALNVYSCPPSVVQYGALAALEMGMEWFDEIRREYKRRRDLACEELNKIPGVRVLKSPGTFYLFPRVKELMQHVGVGSADELAKRILREIGVVMLPGTAFPLRGGEGYLRMSYTLPMERIREGLARLREWVETRT